jgi:ABC-type phosphate transport system auxiliary subunit
MPVTAKLSQQFYQRLGDDVAGELVEWFNAVDATYRSDVRAIADAQSARIDAQMGQMRAELRQEIGDVRSELRQEIAALGAELRVEIAALGAELRVEIAELRAEMRAGFAAVNDRFVASEARTDAKLEGLKAELLRWMFLFWVGTVGAILAMTKL